METPPLFTKSPVPPSTIAYLSSITGEYVLPFIVWRTQSMKNYLIISINKLKTWYCILVPVLCSKEIHSFQSFCFIWVISKKNLLAIIVYSNFKKKKNACLLNNSKNLGTIKETRLIKCLLKCLHIQFPCCLQTQGWTMLANFPVLWPVKNTNLNFLK